MSTKYSIINKYLSDTNVKITDKFFKIKTFTLSESENINNKDNILYLDDYGNLEVYDSESNPLVIFKNKLLNKPLDASDDNIIPSENLDSNFILSNNTLWMLYYDSVSKVYHILYNFIHTPDFAELSTENKTKGDEIFNSYCKTIEGNDKDCPKNVEKPTQEDSNPVPPEDSKPDENKSEDTSKPDENKPDENKPEDKTKPDESESNTVLYAIVLIVIVIISTVLFLKYLRTQR